ncbi:hypothetical protein NRA12_18620 [Acinetobacter baumannii]|nr:hypothetical protein [Acinetobacter baumannii]MDC5366720.1 hypothetical protein [Acinetobacter baumannii]MDC5398470.1 hypothetical protein [Acinetobacter baumannii]
MNEKEYFWLTRKKEPKTKPKSRPLPKATQKYLEAEEDFTQALDVLQIKYEKKFQIKSTKHWRFDFHLIEYRILVEIAGGPWSGGRKGKLKNKAWSLDRYDVAEEMGYTVVRIETASRCRIDESGPLQLRTEYASEWLKNLKRQIFNGSDQTIPTTRLY